MRNNELKDITKEDCQETFLTPAVDGVVTFNAECIFFLQYNRNVKQLKRNIYAPIIFLKPG